MGYQGPIALEVEISSTTSSYFYFGPFRKGEVLRGFVLHLVDATGVAAPVFIGFAVFSSATVPAATAAVFAAGRQLVSGSVVGGIPLCQMPVSPDDAPPLRVPVNYRFGEGDYFFGVHIVNGTANVRKGGLYIDIDVGERPIE